MPASIIYQLKSNSRSLNLKDPLFIFKDLQGQASGLEMLEEETSSVAVKSELPLEQIDQVQVAMVIWLEDA